MGSVSSSLALVGWRGPGKIEVILSVRFIQRKLAYFMLAFLLCNILFLADRPSTPLAYYQHTGQYSNADAYQQAALLALLRSCITYRYFI